MGGGWIQFAHADLVCRRVNQGEAGGDEPLCRQVAAKAMPAPAAFDQLANHTACTLMGAAHRVCVEVGAGGARDLFVVGELLPAGGNQPLQRVQRWARLGFSRLDRRHRPLHRALDKRLEKLVWVWEMRIDRWA